MSWWKIILIIVLSIIIVAGVIYATMLCGEITWVKIPESYYEKNTDKPERVVVSFSTLPGRVDNIQKVLDNLEDQSVRPDLVYINLPHYSKREKVPYSVPEIKSHLKYYINRCEDIGPLTKVLPTLKDIKGENDVIITIDDDQLYHKNFIERMLQGMRAFPECCVTFGGWNYGFLFTLLINLYSPPNTKVDILQGYKGCGYRPKFFKPNFFRNYERFSECFTVDDIYISMHLKSYGVPIIKLKFDKKGTSPLVGELKSTSPLGEINLHGSVWGKCVKRMHKELLGAPPNNAGP
jgi:hypothetical protein